MNIKKPQIQSKETEAPIMVAVYLLVLVWLLGRLTWLYFLTFMSSGFSPDTAWLLQTGNHILAQGALPTHDMFSWTATDRPLVAYQWLFEVLLAAQQKLAGTDFLVQMYAVSGIVLYVPITIALNARYRIPVFFALPVAVASAAIATYNLQIRPMFATCAFLLLQYGLVERLRLGRIGLRVLIPVTVFYYMLWANMHLLVLFGLVSLGLFALADALQKHGDAQFDPPDPILEGQPIVWRDYAWLMGASFVGSLLNPYGYRIYTYLFETLGSVSGVAQFGELSSPNFHDGQMQIFADLLLLFILLMARARSVFAVHEVLHVLAFSLATLYSGRFVVWAALFFAIILPRALWRLTLAIGLIRYRAIHKTVLITEPHRAKIVGGYILVCLGIALLSPRFLASPIPEACAKFEPAIKAYRSLRQDTDRLLNDDIMGSCIIMYPPAPKVFIDTRFDFYGGAHTGKLAKAMLLEENWKSAIAEWNINTFILRKGLPLTELLAVLPECETLYEDGVARIFRLRAGNAGIVFKKSP